MNERSPEEIVQLAHQRIALRHDQERLQSIATKQSQADDGRIWRFAFLITVGMLLAALLFSPGLPLDQKLIIVMQGLCSQENNIYLGGIQFPICARCSGIYISMLITIAYIWGIGKGNAGRIPPWPITAILGLFIVFMGIDGLNSMANAMSLPTIYEPHDVLRNLTGIGTGVALAVFVLLMFNLSLRQDVDEGRSVLQNWREFGGALALSLLVPVAVFGNLHLLAWPLALLAAGGMLVTLFVVNTIMVSLFMGYDGTITRLQHLAKPALFALLPTVLIVSVMSILRFWLETQGLAQ